MAQPSVRETTFSSYELLVRLYVIPGLGKRRLRALQAHHIRTWLNGLRTTCQCCAQGKDAERARKDKARCCARKPAECCGQVAGTGTLRYLLRLVRAALQDALDEELLARNGARQVKMPTGSIRKVAPWSANEARTFLETARHDRLYALWAVALAIGLRRGEALGLRWVDVDLVNGRVVNAKALSRVGANLAVRDVKTESSAASVPLPAELVRYCGSTGVTSWVIRGWRGPTHWVWYSPPRTARLSSPGTSTERSRRCADELACEASDCTTYGIRVRRCCSRWASRPQRCSAFCAIARFL